MAENQEKTSSFLLNLMIAFTAVMMVFAVVIAMVNTGAKWHYAQVAEWQKAAEPVFASRGISAEVQRTPALLEQALNPCRQVLSHEETVLALEDGCMFGDPTGKVRVRLEVE